MELKNNNEKFAIMKTIFENFFEYLRSILSHASANSRIYHFLEPKTSFDKIEIFLN